MNRSEKHTPQDLIFNDVSLSFGDKHVLSHLSFTVPAGTTAVLMGGSGSGKTSVLRLAAGLYRPTSGTVSGGGGRVGVQFQEPRLLPGRTAAENVNAVLSDRRRTLPDARAWLGKVGLEDAADLLPEALSGGMAQRVALCRALAFDADLILLDEPFRGLDPETKDRVIRLVKEETEGKTMLLVTHDTEEAEAFGGNVIRLG